jgi:hypothetical protein
MRTNQQRLRLQAGHSTLWAALMPVLAGLLAVGAQAQAPSVGLSSVRAQRIPNPSLGSFPAQANDHFAWSLAAGDFDGDGRDDLATGIPNDDGPTTAPVTDGGGLIVSRFLTLSGMSPVKFVRQSAALDPPEPFDRFGADGGYYSPNNRGLASCDFDGDGFGELAVGIQLEETVGSNNANQEGAVQVHYGKASGLEGFGREFFTQNTAGIPGETERFDAFGASLACGDFNGDGFEDLVVGVPGEGIGTLNVSAGMIVILPGGSGGLASDFAYSLDQDSSGVEGETNDSDNFGECLAAGDFDGDGFVDLAVGVPGEDDVGAVQIFFGSASGLDGARDLFWYDEDLGGTRESSDEFGAVLASGDFDGDGFDDLAIGVPREEAGSGGGSVDSGEVKIAYGAAGGFNLARSQQFTQGSIPGSGETSQVGDRFGAALAVGDFDRDGRDDLAIGAPDEGISTADGMDGHVTILMGRSHGISPSRARGLVAGRKGIPGSFSEHNKNFGWALAAGDFDGDGHDDLAIGAPFENLGALGDAGAQTILYGSLFADGFESGPGFEFWSSVTP